MERSSLSVVRNWMVLAAIGAACLAGCESEPPSMEDIARRIAEEDRIIAESLEKEIHARLEQMRPLGDWEPPQWHARRLSRNSESPEPTDEELSMMASTTQRRMEYEFQKVTAIERTGLAGTPLIARAEFAVKTYTRTSGDRLFRVRSSQEMDRLEGLHVFSRIFTGWSNSPLPLPRPDDYARDMTGWSQELKNFAEELCEACEKAEAKIDSGVREVWFEYSTATDKWAPMTEVRTWQAVQAPERPSWVPNMPPPRPSDPGH